MRIRVLAVIAAAITMTFALRAEAAPQMLGVIASASPLKLHCSDDICRTEIAVFCMQSERSTPDRHQPYHPHDWSAFSVIATKAGGDVVRVALGDADFRAERGYTAVSVRFSADALRELGLQPSALDVASGGLLIPESQPGDPNPIDQREIAYAMSSLQPAADRVFKTHSKDYEAIRLVNTLVNETPEKGRIAKADRDSLWEDTFGETARESQQVGAHRAADVLGYCQYRTKRGRFFSVRRCLEQRLDGMLMDLNTEYWRAVKPGT